MPSREQPLRSDQETQEGGLLEKTREVEEEEWEGEGGSWWAAWTGGRDSGREQKKEEGGKITEGQLGRSLYTHYCCRSTTFYNRALVWVLAQRPEKGSLEMCRGL